MKSYAQAGQDEWVHSIVGDTGYFVDVGAHDGIVHSNTYALELAGWTGICIEPGLVFLQLETNRTAHCMNVAATDRPGRVSMVGDRISPYGSAPAWGETLTNVLLMAGAPPVIDYLSIDVEGHELEVLAGMDFDRWHVRCCTIEHNLYCDGPARKEAIADIMFANGFERVREDVVADGYGPYEDWYIHRKDLP